MTLQHPPCRKTTPRIGSTDTEASGSLRLEIVGSTDTRPLYSNSHGEGIFDALDEDRQRIIALLVDRGIAYRGSASPAASRASMSTACVAVKKPRGESSSVLR